MRFLDLDKMKVIKSFNFHTIEFNIDLESIDVSIGKMKEASYIALMDHMNHAPIETNYIAHITTLADEEINEQEEEDFFSTLVNVFSAVFFTNFCTTDGRQREHRLDIPPNLKEEVRTAFSNVKRCLNYKTYADKFHFSITWRNYRYDLINQEYEKAESNTIETEFKHDVNELPEKEDNEDAN